MRGSPTVRPAVTLGKWRSPRASEARPVWRKVGVSWARKRELTLLRLRCDAGGVLSCGRRTVR